MPNQNIEHAVQSLNTLALDEIHIVDLYNYFIT